MTPEELADLQLSATEPGQEPRQIFRVTPQVMRPEEASPGLVEQFKSTWIDNYGIAAGQMIVDNEINRPIYDALAEPDYDATPFITPAEAAEYGDVLLTARSSQELEFLRSRIAGEQEARRALAEGPWNPIVVSLLGAFGDPLTYVPVLGQLGKVAQGASIATRVGVVGGMAAAEIAVGEAVAQQTQYTRTASESAMAILLGGTVAAGLGGAGIAISRGLRDSAGEWGKTVDAIAAQVDAPDPLEGGSIGAASRGRDFVAREVDSAPVAAGFARGVNRVFGAVQMAPPALQLAVSKVGAIRGLAHRLVDTGVMTRGELDGIAMAPGGSLDMAIRQRTEKVWETSTFLLHSHKAARRSGYTGKLAEFKKEVHDVLMGGQASHPDVEKVAQKIDENVLTPYERELREAREAAGLKEDPAFGATTDRAHRWARAQKYNPRKISQDLIGFRKSLNEALRKNADLHNKKIDDEIAELKIKVAEETARREAKAAARKAAGRPMSIRATTSERKIRNLEAKKLTDELLGDMASDLELQMLGFEPSGGTTALKVKMQGDSGVATRGVFLDPAIMRSYLVDDAEEMVHGFVRQVAPQIEALNRFGVLDDIEQSPMFAQAKAAADDAVANAKTPKEREALAKQAKRELDLLRKVFSRVVGKQEPAKAIDFMRTTQAALRGVSFMNKMGSVVVSSLTDPGRIVMTEGFLRTARHLGGDVFGLMGSFRATRQTAKMAGTALNMASNTVGSRRWDLGDQFAPRSRTEMAINKASAKFSTATGLPVWTDFWQTFHIQIAQTRILETAKKFADAGGDMAALSPFERLKIAQDNFTPGELLAIAGEADKWVSRGGGIQPNVREWSSRDARGAFLRAIHREGETGIYNPGVGDKPLWTTDPSLGGLGKTVSQFKAFSMAATTRMLLATAQNAAAGQYGRAIASTTFLMMAGMFAQAVHDISKSGEVEKRNPVTWANVGLDRSGLMGMFYELDGMAESMNLPSISTMVTGEPLPRFRSRGPFSQILGPALGQVEDVAKISYGLTRTGMTETTLHGMRRLIPFQNHVIFAHGFNAVEEALVEGFDLPQSRK